MCVPRPLHLISLGLHNVTDNTDVEQGRLSVCAEADEVGTFCHLHDVGTLNCIDTLVNLLKAQGLEHGHKPCKLHVLVSVALAVAAVIGQRAVHAIGGIEVEEIRHRNLALAVEV